MMSTANATAEVFYTAFKSMSKKEKEAIISKLLTDSDFMEDLIDITIIKQRKNEPSRSLDEYVAEKRKKY
ncbi:MAG: hypothetical protein ISS16_10000 [Ignavibacteria bacterium]|nr:hypothetical protein [Ignavibacteria bacterium]